MRIICRVVELTKVSRPAVMIQDYFLVQLAELDVMAHLNTEMTFSSPRTNLSISSLVL